MSIEDRVKRLPGFKARARRPFTRKPMTIYPGITNSGNRWVDFIRSLRKRLITEVPGVDAWSRVGTIAGMMPNPGGIPQSNATAMRKLTLLKHTTLIPTDSQLAVMREVLAAIVYPTRVKPVRFKKGANNGFPDLTGSDDVKKAYVRSWAQEHLQLSRLVDSQDWHGLFDLGMVPLYTNSYRMQADSAKFENGTWIPKKREIFSFDSTSGVQDKTLPALGNDVFASRARQVAMAPQSILFPLRLMIGAFDYTQYEEFRSFKLGAAEAFIAPLSKYKFSAAYDCKNHDQCIPVSLRDAFIDQISLHVTPWIATLLKLSYISPLYAFSDKEGIAGSALFGNLDRPFADPLDYVNPSGHPCTSRFATSAAAAYLGEALQNFLSSTTSEVRGKLGLSDVALPLNRTFFTRLLRDETSLVVRITGDNIFLASDVPEWAPFIKGLVEFSCVGIFGETDTYLGYEVRPGFWAGAIGSFITNLVNVVERDIHHEDRKYWALGTEARREHYILHPAYQLVDAILDEEFKVQFGSTFKEFARGYWVNTAENDPLLNLFYAWPAMVYARPELAEQIPEDKLAVWFTKLPVQWFSGAYQNIYTTKVDTDAH